jgi:HEAT repeat protein
MLALSAALTALPADHAVPAAPAGPEIGPLPEAHQSGDPLVGEIDEPLRDALSGIDYIAGRSVFDELLGTEANTDLVAIARADGDIDPGLRVRAYQALALYPTDLSRTELVAAVSDHTDPGADGIETVYGRAAMDALAQIGGAAATGDLRPVLDHPNADMRAAAAMALAKTGADEAVVALRDRLAVEDDAMVLVALRRSLAALEGE